MFKLCSWIYIWFDYSTDWEKNIITEARTRDYANICIARKPVDNADIVKRHNCIEYIIYKHKREVIADSQRMHDRQLI